MPATKTTTTKLRTPFATNGNGHQEQRGGQLALVPLDGVAVSTTNGDGKPRKVRKKETQPRDRVKPSNADATRRCECTRPMLVHLPGRAEEAQRLQRLLDRYGNAIPEHDQAIARQQIDTLLANADCLKCGHAERIEQRPYRDELDIDPEVWPVLYELGLIGSHTTKWWSSSPMSSTRAGGKRKRR